MEEAREPRLNLDAQNPLLINEIAKRILQFVPVSHLKDCRLVCQLWWKESLPRWRRSQWLVLTTNEPDAGRLETADGERHVYDLIQDEEKLQKHLFVGTFLNLLSKPDPYQLQKYPFQKLHLFRSKLRLSGKHWKDSVLQLVLEEIGPFVTSLIIEKCTIYTRQDFLRIVFQLSPKLEYLSLSNNIYKANCTARNELTNLEIERLVENSTNLQPKLAHLKLSMALMDSTKKDQLPLTWTQFFAHFPNIKKLELVTCNGQEWKRGSGYDYYHILISIKALRRDCGILQQLTGLDLLNLEDRPTDRFMRGLLNTLQEICLPLTFFAYDIGFKHKKRSRLSELLKIGAETLETLIIYKTPLSPPFGDFPYGNNFPNLTKLTLVGPIVNDLGFLEHMPLLKSLRLFYGMESDYPVQPSMPEPKVLGQLRTFKNDTGFPYGDEAKLVDRVKVVKNTDFSLMAHLTFVDLEELIIGKELCTASQIEQLARLMPNLKRLRIGLDNNSFRAVCSFWSGLEALDAHPLIVDDEGITGIVGGRARFPNITDLKSVRFFGMGEGLKSTELTEFSLKNGLLQLKYLEGVSLRCSQDKMSDDAFDNLKAGFPPPPYSSIYRNQIDDVDDDSSISSSPSNIE